MAIPSPPRSSVTEVQKETGKFFPSSTFVVKAGSADIESMFLLLTGSKEFLPVIRVMLFRLTSAANKADDSSEKSLSSIEISGHRFCISRYFSFSPRMRPTDSSILNSLNSPLFTAFFIASTLLI